MKKTKIFAMMLSVIMVLTMSVLPVFADNYTAIAGTSTELTKYLVVPNNAEIPGAEFSFTVSAGNAVEATATTIKTWAGVNPELVKVNETAETGKVTFVAGESTTAGAADDGIANSVDKKYASKTIKLDFSGVSFTEPGVYRYILTENASTNSAINIDTVPTRTIDVYVSDNEGALEISSYVVYEGTATEAGKLTSPAEAGKTKSTKFVNNYETHDLTVSKTVTGRSGSHDQYFEFTITVNGAGAGTVMTLDMTDAETAPHENTATTFGVEDMAAANTKDDDADKVGQQIIADANGSATFKVYMHHGQQVVLKGLPKDATYTVVETAADGYEVTKTNDSGTIANADVTAAFTNNRGGIVPTGIMTAAGFGVGIMLISGGLLVVRAFRRKDEENE